MLSNETSACQSRHRLREVTLRKVTESVANEVYQKFTGSLRSGKVVYDPVMKEKPRQSDENAPLRRQPCLRIPGDKPVDEVGIPALRVGRHLVG